MKIILFSKKVFLVCAISALSLTYLNAQNPEKKPNPIYTSVPSLLISPDARGGAMGDIGVSTSADIYSQYWNAAKYPFANSKGGFAISYTPWLSKFFDDMSLSYITGYYKIGEEGNQAISSSFRYFSLGNVSLTDLEGTVLNNIKPHELAFDVAYSAKLSETFSGAVTLRYIRSDFSTGDDKGGNAGNAFAADIAGYNENTIATGDTDSKLGLGFNISNIGTKIPDGDNTSSFIPTNLRLGGTFTYAIDTYNDFAISCEINKLLVPTPPMKKDGENETEWNNRLKEYNTTSSIGGMFKSLTQAPGGFSEKIKEFNYALGLEYTYDKAFSIRTGYFNENELKGNRKFFSVGAGVKMSFVQLDVAYLISTVQSNPLDKTLRFSLGFDMDGLAKLFN